MSGDHPSSSHHSVTPAIPLRHLSPNIQLRIPRSVDVNQYLNNKWASLNPASSAQQSILQEPITLSSDSPRPDEEFLESAFRVGVEDPLRSLDEYLDDLEGEVSKPSKVGIGKGKEIRYCDKFIQERVCPNEERRD